MSVAKQTNIKRPVPGRTRGIVIWLQRRILALSRRWLMWANVSWGVLTGLPWLAPVLMKLEARTLAKALYLVYSTACHQLANRSFFLFGSKPTYSYSELLPHPDQTNTMLALQMFTGTPELGYKVAWSDRMVSLYGGIFLGGLIFSLLRHRLLSPRWRTFLLLTIPMVLDGGSHFISDLAGVGQGFRYGNAWLAALTVNMFPSSFYVVNELGSFNSWMRLSTGLLFGMAVVWMLYPAAETFFQETRQTLAPRLQRVVSRPSTVR